MNNTSINPIRPGLFGCLGQGERKVPAAFNSKAIHGTQTKFDKVVENRKIINLVVNDVI